MKKVLATTILALLAFVLTSCTEVCSTCRTEYGQFKGDSSNTVYIHDQCGNSGEISDWEEQERQNLLQYKKVSGVPFSECVCVRN